MSAAEGRIAVVAAMPEEARAIARALGTRASSALRAEPAGLVVAWTGDGASRARRNLALLLNRVEPGRLIGAGVAGALTEDLTRGTICRPSQVFDEIGNRIALAAGHADMIIVSAARPLFSSIEKRRVAESLGLERNAIVDLETFAWAELAQAFKTPFSALRVVLDDSREDLPGFLARAVRPDGSTDRRAIGLAAILRPDRVLLLLKLRREFRAACAALAAAVAAALRERF
jgi:hypothetical protein